MRVAVPAAGVTPCPSSAPGCTQWTSRLLDPEALAAEIGERVDIRICQANLYEPPFAAQSFDFVMSWGVLHHTRSTYAGFKSVARLVKPGGTLYVMVYPPAPYLQGPGTDLLRIAMRRMPDERRYDVCKHLIIRNRYLAFALGRVLMIGYYDPNNSTVDPESLQFGLFDAYSPRWNHRHRADEVVKWFREEGFREVTVIDPGTGNVRVRGQRPALAVRIAIFDNLANNAYIQAKAFHKRGIPVDLVLNPLDTFAMSDPRWEDLDSRGLAGCT